MDQFIFDLLINTLQQYKDINNAINEISNILPDKHKEVFNDYLSEIEKVSNNLEQVEKDIYYDYVKNEMKDPVIKPYEIEDFYMIENVFINDPDQLSLNDITYLFKLLNKFIKE